MHTLTENREIAWALMG